MTTDVEKDADAKVTLTYEVLDPDGKLLSLGTDPVVKIEEPRLWWPHGNGEQPLYTVRVIMESEGEAAQEKLYRIGLRTVTVSREDDEWGQEFAMSASGLLVSFTDPVIPTTDQEALTVNDTSGKFFAGTFIDLRDRGTGNIHLCSTLAVCLFLKIYQTDDFIFIQRQGDSF